MLLMQLSKQQSLEEQTFEIKKINEACKGLDNQKIESLGINLSKNVVLKIELCNNVYIIELQLIVMKSGIEFFHNKGRRKGLKVREQINEEKIYQRVIQHGRTLSHGEAPRLQEYKPNQKINQISWGKSLNLGKEINSIGEKKTQKTHKKQKSADVMYLMSKTEIPPLDELLSTNSNYKNQQKIRKTNKAIKFKALPQKKKSKDINKKAKKEKLSSDRFHPSKLPSLDSVDASLVQSTTEEDIPYCLTEIIKPSDPFDEDLTDLHQEIRQYRNLSQVLPPIHHEEQQNSIHSTKSIITKYISNSLFGHEQLDIPAQFYPSKKRQDNRITNKIQQMLKQIKNYQKQSGQPSEKITEYSNSLAQLKTMDICHLNRLFEDRKKDLTGRRSEELLKLEGKLGEGQIQEQQFIQEKHNINKWVNYQIENTKKVQNVLRKGMSDALHLLKKTELGITALKDSRKREWGTCKSCTYLKVMEYTNPKIMPSSPISVEPQPNPSPVIFTSPILELKEVKAQPEPISLEKKEDVVEYIFIDLCLQIFQEEKGDIIKKKVIKMKEDKKKRRKGFDVGKREVLGFMNGFLQFVENSEQRIKKMWRILQKPIGPTPLQMLRYMRNEEAGQYEEVEDISYVFQFSWFEAFSKKYIENYEFDPYFFEEQKQEKRVNFLRHALHFHNKAIFDAINENIDKHRPYGLFGIPFPWKNKPQQQHRFNQAIVEGILKKIVQEVSESCLYLCGIMIDKQCSQLTGYGLMQQELNELREDRMSRLLCNDVAENEPRWFFFDDEEAQIMVEVGSRIYQSLLLETVAEISFCH